MWGGNYILIQVKNVSLIRSSPSSWFCMHPDFALCSGSSWYPLRGNLPTAGGVVCCRLCSMQYGCTLRQTCVLSTAVFQKYPCVHVSSNVRLPVYTQPMVLCWWAVSGRSPASQCSLRVPLGERCKQAEGERTSLSIDLGCVCSVVLAGVTDSAISKAEVKQMVANIHLYGRLACVLLRSFSRMKLGFQVWRCC